MTGKRVYGEPHESRDAAELERITKKPPEPKPVKHTVPSFEVWADHQLQARYGQVDIAVSTFDTNETIRLLHIEGSHFGRLLLPRITRADCQEWVDGLKGGGAWVRRCAAFASKLFSLAIEQGWRESNPMRGIKLPRVEERENAVLSGAQAVALMNPKTRLGAMILVSLLTGIRRGELCRLEWKHVRDDHLAIPVTKPRKTTRMVSLLPEAKEAIDAQPRRSQYVFSTEKGTAVAPHNLTRDFRLAKKELGIPEATRLQDLRGSFISLLFSSGADPRTVMELVGHASIKTTMQSYARSNTPAKQAAVLKLYDAMGLKQPAKKRARKVKEATS